MRRGHLVWPTRFLAALARENAFTNGARLAI